MDKLTVTFLRRQAFCNSLCGEHGRLAIPRNTVFPVNLCKMLEEDSPNFENRLTDHVDIGMVCIHDQFAFHIGHGGTAVVDNSIAATAAWVWAAVRFIYLFAYVGNIPPLRGLCWASGVTAVGICYVEGLKAVIAAS